MTQMLFGKMALHSAMALARIGVPDHMSDLPRPVEDIAAGCGAHAPSLYRVLRLLSSLGLFTEGPARHFALTGLGAVLQTDHPRSMRDMAIMFSDPWVLTAYSRMDDVLRTGTDGPTLAFGEHGFHYLAKHPAEAANFNRAMTGFSAVTGQALLQIADFSQFTKMADCGGGHGWLLSTILQRFPNLRGVLYDLPEVIQGAPAAGHFAPCADRIEYQHGSFLESVPSGCDAYFMKHIIHDWDDESCRKILSLMRDELLKTASKTGRIFICEMVVGETPEPGPAKFLDIEMLVCTPGGKERTAAEFAALFASAGLRLVSITPSQSPICLIEAAPL